MSYRVFEGSALDYDRWFDRHKGLYRSELEALKKFFPAGGTSVEVGAGTGRFAGPLGVTLGIEPSRDMALLAAERGVKIARALAEELPLKDRSIDALLMVTTVCFLDDVERAFEETQRVLKPGAVFVVGEIDRESPLGRLYESKKKDSLFYREARFYSTDELVDMLRKKGFKGFAFRQTVFSGPSEGEVKEPVIGGYGSGGFVAIRVFKA